MTKTPPHPRFVEFVRRFIESSGGLLAAHRQAVEAEGCFGEGSEERGQWESIRREIHRQSKVEVVREFRSVLAEREA